jgi:hypothetical protein
MSPVILFLGGWVTCVLPATIGETASLTERLQGKRFILCALGGYPFLYSDKRKALGVGTTSRRPPCLHERAVQLERGPRHSFVNLGGRRAPLHTGKADAARVSQLAKARRRRVGFEPEIQFSLFARAPPSREVIENA